MWTQQPNSLRHDVTTAALADPAKINDNFTDVYALLNAMRTALVATGWMKGAA